MIQIAPSLLAANFARLGDEVAAIENHADWLHLDIMDGQFVPNISYGFPVIEALRPLTKIPFDVHLMTNTPNQYLKAFYEAGANMLTVHVEAVTHLHRTVSFIKELGCLVGIALNPHTGLECLEYVLDDLDLVLLMTVNPGFGGQSFIEGVLPKVSALQLKRQERGMKDLIIAVDGGINFKTAPKAIAAGANMLVAGSAVFGAENPCEAIMLLKQLGFSSPSKKDA